MPHEFRRRLPLENNIQAGKILDLRSVAALRDVYGELKNGYKAVLFSIGGFDYYYFIDDQILTPVERYIAIFLMQQKTRKEIAQTLDMSPATVRTHVSAIYSKLSLRSDEDINRPAHVQKFLAGKGKLVLVSEYRRFPVRSTFSEIELKIIELLRKDWDPELISAFLHIEIDMMLSIMGSLIKKLAEAESFDMWK